MKNYFIFFNIFRGVGKNIENKSVLVFNKIVIDYTFNKIDTSDSWGGDY